ncbi:MAG: hypothetical protein HC923_12990 [Myxococcales bacterium]|nr:hypothetical protein [Myxococcales bacterium]
MLTLWQEGRELPFLHIVNADGSEPEMCGNGLRCVVHYLALGGEMAPEVETPAGRLRGEPTGPGRPARRSAALDSRDA